MTHGSLIGIRSNLVLTGLLAFAPFVVGCGTSDGHRPGDTPPDSPEERAKLLESHVMQRIAASPTRTVTGTVVSVADQPLAGISVTIDGHTTVTDSSGHYTVSDIFVGKHVVTFEHAQYVLTQRPVTVAPGDDPQVDVNLLSRSAVQSLDVDAGGSLVQGPLSLALEPGVLQFADGAEVHGRVDVVMTVLDPRATGQISASPSRLEGIDENGRQIGLASYGMVEIEASQGGKKLQVRPGRSVTASMNITGIGNVAAAAQPASIPMWHLDTSTGMWVQERSATTSGIDGGLRNVGAATVQKNAAGALVATAELPHFSWWNWDVSSGATCTILTVPASTAISGLRAVSTDSTGALDPMFPWEINAQCLPPYPTGTRCITNSPSGSFTWGGDTYFKYQVKVGTSWCDVAVVLDGVEKTVLQGNDINNWLTEYGLSINGTWCGDAAPPSGTISGPHSPTIDITMLPPNRVSLVVSSSVGACTSFVGGRTANLTRDLGYRTMTTNAMGSNRLDIDRDGVNDGIDTCVTNSSAQTDSNGNRIGDACESYCIIPLTDPMSPVFDFDQDGIDDMCDNNFSVVNPSLYVTRF